MHKAIVMTFLTVETGALKRLSIYATVNHSIADVFRYFAAAM